MHVIRAAQAGKFCVFEAKKKLKSETRLFKCFFPNLKVFIASDLRSLTQRPTCGCGVGRNRKPQQPTANKKLYSFAGLWIIFILQRKNNFNNETVEYQAKHACVLLRVCFISFTKLNTRVFYKGFVSLVLPTKQVFFFTKGLFH